MGARVERQRQVRASSAKPAASLAIIFAVAGANKTKSHLLAKEICAGLIFSGSANKSETTLLALKVCRVSGVINSVASLVITTVTLNLRFLSRLIISQAL